MFNEVTKTVEWVKTTAKSVPEAIDLALDNLGVDEAEAEIEVLEEPKSSFLGLRTKGVARVRARVKPRPIRAKQTRDRKNNKRKSNSRDGRRDRQGSGQGSNQSRNNRGRSQNKASSGATKSQTGRSDRAKGATPITNAHRTGAQQDGGSEQSSSSAKSNRSRNDSSSKQSRNRNKSRTAPAVATVTGSANGQQKGRAGQGKAGGNKNQNPKNKESASVKSTPEQETPVEEVSNHLEGFLGGLTKAFGLEGAVIIDDSEENTLIATVEGQHGLMVGPKGRTLDAIQELARISSQRTAPSSVRIKVDVGGYRVKRNEALANFARKAADKAVDNGVEVALEPMTPADRKIVHDALTDDRRVETRSVGHEPRRKVLVVPIAGANGNAGDEDE